MHKIILIEKYNDSSFFWPNLLKSKKIEEYTVEQILNKYQGFEGELIFISEFEGINSIKKIFSDYLDIIGNKQHLLLHVISNFETMPSFLTKQAIHLGYDVGVCEEEKTIYSSIFNEILFGYFTELIDFNFFLNENLLFPDKYISENYISQHNKLSAQGKGVEDYEEMIIYEIWKQENIKLDILSE